MSDRPMYHEESRKLQDQFDTRRLADRLVETLVRQAFTEEDRTFTVLGSHPEVEDVAPVQGSSCCR